MAINESICESFMREALRSDRCRQLLAPIPLRERARIVCRSCRPELNARAYFNPDTKNVTLCYNYLPTKVFNDDKDEPNPSPYSIDRNHLKKLSVMN